MSLIEKNKFPIIDTKEGMRKLAYGLKFPVNIPDYKIELHCAFRYRLTPEQGGLGPKEHLWNYIELEYPEFCQRDNFFMDIFFDNIMSNKYKFYFAIGPGGFGKTTLASLYAIAAYIENPKETAVIACTTTKDSAEGRIWGKIKQLYGRHPEYETFSKVTNNQIYYRQKINGKLEKDTFHSMRVSALPKGEGGADSIIRGIHPDKKLILILDEMDQSAGIDDVVDNLQKGGVDFTLIGLGNPSDRFSTLGLACEPFGGWKSIDALNFTDIHDCAWDSTIDDGRVLFFPGYLNPRIVHTKQHPHLEEYYADRFNYFSSEEELQQKKITVEHGKYMEQYIGFFPERNTDGKEYVLEKSEILSHKAHIPATFAGYGNITLLAACDPSFTSGGDQTIFRVGKLGRFINGKLGLCFMGKEHIHRIEIPRVVPYNKYKYIAEAIIDLLKHYEIQPKHFCIDANSSGDAIIEFLYQLWSDNFSCFHSKGRPTERPLYRGTSLSAKDECTNRLTEYWVAGRKLILSGQIGGLDPITIDQISSRLVIKKDSTAKVTIEAKHDYKKRMTSIGRAGRSPDEADTAMYLINLARNYDLVVDHENRALTPNEQTELPHQYWNNYNNEDILEWERQKQEALDRDSLHEMSDFHGSEDSDNFNIVSFDYDD